MHVSTQATTTLTWPRTDAPCAHVSDADEAWVITRIIAHSSMMGSRFIEVCGHRIMASGAHSPYCVRTRVASLEQVAFTDQGVQREIATALREHEPTWPAR